MNRTATALGEYKSIGLQGRMTDATPHHMINLLFEGALDRIAGAKGATERNEIARKGELLGSAIRIIDGLRASLDYEQGGEISVNLASLYDYMERRLAYANLNNDIAAMDEVSGLLREIKTGWDSIPDTLKKG
jgi:flagellar secretion chaperone FliS